MHGKDIKNKIKSLDLSNYRLLNGYIKKNPDIKEYCQIILKKYPSLDKLCNVLYFIQSNKKEPPKCIVCGKYINYTNYLHFHSTHCSLNCVNCRNSDSKLHSKTTNLLRKYYKMKNLFKDYVIPLFSAKEYKGRQYKYKWKCVKCGNIFESNISNTTHFQENINVNLKRLPRCLKCYPKCSGFSNQEKQLLLFCKQYFKNILENDKKLIKPYELDIVIPEIKLAIEYNGVFYHSNLDKNYHLNKTELAEKQNYRLIHIWENDWLENKDIIKQKLINIFLNKEVIDLSKPLDRCWYQLKNIDGYKLNILQPEEFTYKTYTLFNCGYLEYIKL